MSRTGKVPSYFVWRIQIVAALLYFLMVIPFAGFILLQNIPVLIEKGAVQINDQEEEKNNNSSDEGFSLTVSPAGKMENDTTTATKDSPPDSDNNTPIVAQSKLIGKSFNFLFTALLVGLILVKGVNLPFQHYFRRKRRGKPVSERWQRFCRKYLLYTPLVNAGIAGTVFLINLIYVLIISYTLKNTASDEPFPLINRFFLISFFSSLLAVLFIYFWQRHRVHLRYLDHVFEPEELQKSIFRKLQGKIQYRFLLSSAMTTFLPLVVVIVYLMMSLTRIEDLKIESLSSAHLDILFGRYSEMMRILYKGEDPSEDVRDLFYVNAMDGMVMIMGIMVGVLAALIYLILFVRWTTMDIVYPIRELMYHMQLTGEGKSVHYTVVRSNDEIGRLAVGYNEMAGRIENYIRNISRLNEAYYRFVPRQFIENLGKESIIDIKLGDQVQKEMSVMFTDIRDFTALSEQMTPKENFDFLNDYLSRLEPIITRHHGFIDKYIGDSIMALFEGNPEHSLDAAIEIMSAISAFNEQRRQEGKVPVVSGAGIHSGRLMLGIVGGEGRMDSTVVSDVVNLASRIEGLTRIYGCAVIVSQNIIGSLQTPEKYHYRYLDAVKVKGKSQPTIIFEILDAEPESVREMKLRTSNNYHSAIQYYQNRQFSEALQLFRSIAELNPHDHTVKLYISRCEQILRSGIPQDWDGITVIGEKC